MRVRTLAIAVPLGLLAAFVLLPGLAAEVPGRDQGVFLYVGQRILRGELPYRDVWDHKGPLIYYINALGLLLGGGTAWGVRVLEWLSIWGASWLGYVVMSEAFGATAAAVVSFAWLVSLPALLGGGDLTEEFSLPLQFLSLFLFWRSGRNNRPACVSVAIGACLGCSFLLRPNNVGIQLAIVGYLLLGHGPAGSSRRAVRHMLAVCLGAAAVIAPVCLYLWVHGALGAAIDAVVRYNSIYSGADLQTRVLSVMRGLRALLPSGVSALSLTGWLLGLTRVLSRREADRSRPLLIVVLVVLPIELVLSSLSGRAYDHYFILWLPGCAVLTAYLIQRGLDYLATKSSTGVIWRGRWTTIGVPLALLLGVVPIWRMLPDIRQVLAHGRAATPVVVEYILTHTRTDDYVLMWGAETSYNYLSGRASPTRFAYQYPLYSCQYRTTAMVEELLRGVVSRRPLVVDTSPTNLRVPPIDAQDRAEWYSRYGGCALLPPMDAVVGYFDANYELIDEIEPVGWYVYSYHGESPR